MKGGDCIKHYHVVLISHGGMAEATLQSSNMILGEVSNFSALGLYETMGPDDLKEKLEEMMEASPVKDVIIITDIVGGTPFNTAIRLSAENKCKAVISGLTLSMIILLETMFQDAQDLSFMESFLSDARSSIMQGRIPKTNTFSEEDE